MNKRHISLALLLVAASLGSATPSAAAQGGSKPPPMKAFQEATANSIGNIAWEAVKVTELRSEGALMKWNASTPLGVWRCQSQPDAKKPYCEREEPAPRPAAAAAN